MYEDLKNKVVLITGSSKGIGAAAAKGFGKCGAKVVVHGFASADAAQAVVDDIKKDGGEAILLLGDVTKQEVIEGLVDQTVDHYGRIDVLVNNAGDLVKRVGFGDIDGEIYDKVLDLNVRSVVFASQRAYSHFKKQGDGGNIITTGSLAARNGGGVNAGLYGASKAFVETFTRWMAAEYGPEGVRCNCVSPGFIVTRFHEEHTPQERWDQVANSVPMHRLGHPEDCAGAYLYLASNEASGWVTGHMLQINGGAMMV